MTQHERVLSSISPIPQDPDHPIYCTKKSCTALATYFWPMLSEDPEPYCEECLNKALASLCIALGSQ